MSVYDITYETLGHTHPRIYTILEMDEYRPPKKCMEPEWNYLGNLSSIYPKVK